MNLVETYFKYAMYKPLLNRVESTVDIYFLLQINIQINRIVS